MTNVYIEANHANPFRSGYGLVIVNEDSTQELGSTDSNGSTTMRLLLVGCLAVLRLVPEDVPVQVHCSVEYLTCWTLPRLAKLKADGFKKKGKLMPNHDVMAELAELVERRAAKGGTVDSVVVPKAEWCDHHVRAEAIALEHGAGGVPRVKPIWRAKPKVDRPALLKGQPTAITTTEAGVTVADYGKAGDGEVLPW